MPWIRHIYILAKDNNIKSFVCEFSNASIVKCKNMHIASMELHKISKLADKFITFSEYDFPSYYSDYRSWFSEDGKPQIAFQFRLKTSNASILHSTLIDNMLLVNKISQKQYYFKQYFMPLPCAKAMTKSIVKECYAKIKQYAGNKFEKYNKDIYWQYAQQNKLCLSNDNFNVFQFFDCFKLLKNDLSLSNVQSPRRRPNPIPWIRVGDSARQAV